MGNTPAAHGVLALLGVALVAACDLPTGAPSWDTTWVVATDSALMSVGKLLPDELFLTRDSTRFILELGDTTVAVTLGELCGQPCRAVDGTTAPKPGFDGVAHHTVALSDPFGSLPVETGAIHLRLSHSFDFDPLRPGGGATGRIEVTVRSGGAVVGTLVLDGDTMSFPAGTDRTGTVDLAGQSIEAPLGLETRVVSPAGGAAFIDTRARLDVELADETIVGPSATIRVDKTVSIEQAEFDFRDVDSTVVNHILEGGLRLRIDNPWPIHGRLTLQIRSPGREITRSFELLEGVFDTRVRLSGDELQSILGALVTLDARGAVLDAGTVFDVTPDQYMVIYPKLEATIRVGEV